MNAPMATLQHAVCEKKTPIAILHHAMYRPVCCKYSWYRCMTYDATVLPRMVTSPRLLRRLAFSGDTPVTNDRLCRASCSCVCRTKYAWDWVKPFCYGCETCSAPSTCGVGCPKQTHLTAIKIGWHHVQSGKQCHVPAYARP